METAASAVAESEEEMGAKSGFEFPCKSEYVVFPEDKYYFPPREYFECTFKLNALKETFTIH